MASSATTRAPSRTAWNAWRPPPHPRSRRRSPRPLRPAGCSRLSTRVCRPGRASTHDGGRRAAVGTAGSPACGRFPCETSGTRRRPPSPSRAARPSSSRNPSDTRRQGPGVVGGHRAVPSRRRRCPPPRGAPLPSWPPTGHRTPWPRWPGARNPRTARAPLPTCASAYMQASSSSEIPVTQCTALDSPSRSMVRPPARPRGGGRSRRVPPPVRCGASPALRAGARAPSSGHRSRKSP